MTKPFLPKGREELRKEVISPEGLNIADVEENQDLIEKTVDRLFKEEEFKASEKNKTAKSREALEKMTRGKEFYKKGGKPKGDTSKDNKPNGELISLEDKAYLFGRLRKSRTEVRHLEKVMKLTGKSLNKALGDRLFTSWKKENDALIRRQGSSLDASRGGGGRVEEPVSKLADKFAAKLPPGFKFKKTN